MLTSVTTADVSLAAGSVSTHVGHVRHQPLHSSRSRVVDGVSADNSLMHPLLAMALNEAKPLVNSRGWVWPSPSTLAEAERLLSLVSRHRLPTIEIDADGSIRFEWEAAETGWLTLTVDGSGQVRHSAVIGEDEFERSEVFGDVLPEWATTLLERIVQVGH